MFLSYLTQTLKLTAVGLNRCYRYWVDLHCAITFLYVHSYSPSVLLSSGVFPSLSCKIRDYL